MKYFLSAILAFSIVSISSCSKDTTIINNAIFGEWHWKSSLSSNGTQMVSNDSSKVFNIILNTDFSFTNSSFCVIGGPTEGTFEISGTGAAQLLILKSQNSRPDTFKITLNNNNLTLTETFDSYSWFHDFNKKQFR